MILTQVTDNVQCLSFILSNQSMVKKNVSKKLCDNDFCDKSITKFHNLCFEILFSISNLAIPSENFWKLVKLVSLKCLPQTLLSSVHPGHFLVLFTKLFHFLRS